MLIGLERRLGYRRPHLDIYREYAIANRSDSTLPDRAPTYQVSIHIPTA